MVVHVHMNFILFLHSTNERVEKETQYSKSDENTGFRKKITSQSNTNRLVWYASTQLHLCEKKYIECLNMFYKNVNQFHYFPIVIIHSLYCYMYEVNHIKHRFTPIYQKATYVHVTTKISQKMSAFLQMANYF